MRARIKITDLNLRQWDHITTKVPVNGRTFLEGVPRVCAVFELSPDISELHVEMDVAELAGLMTVLESIRNDPDPALVAQAALTPDALPDHLVQLREAADPARAETVRNTGPATATGPGSVANTGVIRNG